jgi:hypothetical protein
MRKTVAFFILVGLAAMGYSLAQKAMSPGATTPGDGIRRGQDVVAIIAGDRIRQRLVKWTSVIFRRGDADIACIVEVETKVIEIDGGTLRSKVLVVDGPHAGCEGTIRNDRLAEVPR